MEPLVVFHSRIGIGEKRRKILTQRTQRRGAEGTDGGEENGARLGRRPLQRIHGAV